MSNTSTASTPIVDTTPHEAVSARNRLVIGLLLASAFVVILNETIMGVALPELMIDLSITATAAQWLTTAFLLTMATVIPITGFLLQRFTTRPVFITAMSMFSLGTLIAALAPGFEVLLVGRVIQAVGTAIMMPLLMTTVLNLVPAESRGRMMGNIAIVISVAPAIGPTISGIILNSLEWRWMFIIVLPIALTALALGVAKIQNVSTPKATRLDVPSVILAAFGFGGLVYGLSNLGEAAAEMGPIAGWGPLCVGVIALLLFVQRQLRLQKTDSALLDLRTFTSRNFTLSTTMLAISMMALFGTIILLPLFTQTALGLDTLTTGLLLLPGGLIMGSMAPFVGRAFDRFGPRLLLVAGSLLVSSAFFSMSMMDDTTSIWRVLLGHMTLSAGLALLFTPLFSAGLGSLPRSLYSHGSATVSTIQQVAGAIGTAVFIAVMTTQSAALLATGAGDTEAIAGGITTAFFYGTIISLFAIPLAFLIRRPTEPADGERMPAGH
ncbi:MAG: DHA2 family efflux MFS transporter permease subunit [Burkholderiaceae bacterium]|nr:DHA2 family efflux MFS transporter permease subunit [Microbacteriaceae bacterium]